jgi:hypothetical protein
MRRNQFPVRAFLWLSNAALAAFASEFLGRSHSTGAGRCGSKERVGDDSRTGAEVLRIAIIAIVKEP